MSRMDGKAGSSIDPVHPCMVLGLSGPGGHGPSPRRSGLGRAGGDPTGTRAVRSGIRGSTNFDELPRVELAEVRIDRMDREIGSSIILYILHIL